MRGSKYSLDTTAARRRGWFLPPPHPTPPSPFRGAKKGCRGQGPGRPQSLLLFGPLGPNSGWHFIDGSLALVKSPQRELVDQAQARVPYTPHFGVIHVAHPREWYQMSFPCKIITLGGKLIPQ